MHIQSMTGFGQSKATLPGGTVAVELRSVNNRFLDLSLRIPDELRHLESAVRELVSRRVPRGKVELRLALQREHSGSQAVAINQAVADELIRVQAELAQRHPGHVQPWSPSDLLRWPGVVAEATAASTDWDTHALQAIGLALADFESSRQREGGRMAEVMLARLTEIEAQLAMAQEHLPRIQQALADRLAERLREALAGLQGPEAEAALAERIRSEAQAAALRADVGEEMDRLASHIAEMRRILQAPTEASVGKRLDFLTQELHREANTFGSKSAHLASTQMAMEMKLAIEQIREQVQNIQ